MTEKEFLDARNERVLTKIRRINAGMADLWNCWDFYNTHKHLETNNDALAKESLMFQGQKRAGIENAAGMSKLLIDELKDLSNYLDKILEEEVS